MSATERDEFNSDYFDYRHPDLELDAMPAYMAIMLLATKLADELDTGLANDNGETDGRLDGPVLVTETGVLGPELAVATMAPNTATVTIYVSDDANPLEQLRGILDQIDAHCIAGWVR